MRSLLNKKRGAFEIDQLQSVVITLVVIGIVLGLGLIVLGEFMDETDDATATERINETLQAVGSIGGWLSLIVLVIVIGIILAIVFRVLPGARTPTAPMGY